MSRLAAPLGLPLLLLALLSAAAHAGLTVEMSFDGSESAIASLLAEVSRASAVPLACDDALKDVALRVYGTGPAYRLLGSLEWITGGQWRLEQPGWLLVGPADRPPLAALLKRLTPDVATGAVGPSEATARRRLEQIAQFSRLVLAGREQPVEWKWSTLTVEQRRTLMLLTLSYFASGVAGKVTRQAPYACSGPLCDGCRIAWLPEPEGFEKVQLTSADGRLLAWTAEGAFTPAQDEKPIGEYLESPVTLELTDALLGDVLGRLSPPLSFVVSCAGPYEKRGTVSAEGKAVLEVVSQIKKGWDVPCQVDPFLHTLAVGELPSRHLLPDMATSAEVSMASLEGYLDDVRAAIAQEGPPETRSWSSLTLPQVEGWFSQVFRGLAEHLSTSQRVMLRDQGGLPVESLSAEQRQWLLTAMDVQWRVMVWGVLTESAPYVDFERLSGEVSRERLTIKHPGLRQPMAFRVPQE